MTTPTWQHATLADALARRTERRGESVAVRFIEPGGATLADSALATLTYAELRARAAAVAEALMEQDRPGDRALLLCPPGIEYIAALFGCFHAGVIAVPAYPPATAGFDERLTRLIGDSAPTAILTVKAIADFCEALCLQAGRAGTAPRVILVDALEPCECSVATPARSPGDLALLQYTSGSTGEPRGVMLTHANLLATVSSVASHLELGSDARAVYWLPPFHDMGLVSGILTPVLLGAETTLLSPLSFLASPLLWLEAVSRFRGTFSAAPNFAYDLCVRKVTSARAATLDLSQWKSVVNGAEPVRAQTMDRFVAHFECAGFRRSAFMPAYGLAEATLVVSTARLGARRRPAGAAARNPADDESSPPGSVVSVGVPDDDATVLIVHPETRLAVPEGEVGEIWFRGPGVAAGYWHSPEASEATFAATLAEDADGVRFLRTGDLGELRGGELYVSGRIKDLVIVRGQNYHPHDIELAASNADDALRPGCLAAFGVDDDEAGQRLVLVAELARELQYDEAGRECFERVRTRVGRDVGLALDELVLIERGAILKTSSGKIRRSATRAAYLEEDLPVLAWCRSPRAAAGDAHDDATATAASEHGWALSASPNGARDTRALLEQHLAEYTRRERDAILRLTVLTHLGSLLGHVSPETIDPERTFKELGLESAQAVELSGRLREATGLELGATLCFEYPTPGLLASHLASLLEGLERPRVAGRRPRTSDEPVAIVGMACRFPGGVDSPERLWALVGRGADAISEFPRDRGWDLGRLFDADRELPGTSHAREGGFIADAAAFDAGFFGISAPHAAAIDPQQRLLLEVAWEALEDAGIDPETLAGSATGVFAGASSVDHAIRLGAARGRELEAHLLTGAAASAISGRVSYTLGLRGAAVTVDTACSSSLVALHEACRVLAEGECSLALAGGVTVLSTPAVFTGFSRQGGLAADGRCKPFAAAADGTGFSEGAGLLVLERLRDAQEHGHRVLAVVRGSAVNQDGRSNGFTAPSPSAQEEVIRAALHAAGLTPQEVDAVEAHGTGTVLGDPIEAQALIAAYGRGRASPLWLGSVKSNLGHTQAAAGVASVMKMVMAMRHDLLPKTLHVDEPSPHVDWEAGAVRLLSGAREWPRGERPRRAGVSSFGISGTNAHVILEDAPARLDAERPKPLPALPWVLSAKSESALRATAERLRSQVERRPDLDPLDVAYTLATGRARMQRRAAIVGGDREALRRGLDALASSERSAGVLRGLARADAKVAFVFGGQGAQWDGMARGLIDSSAVFAYQLRSCAEALSHHVDWSLEDVLRGTVGAPALDRVDVVQPALWAVMVSLAELWRSFGVRPSIVAGHSQGEIAAAQLAGGLSLEDAARLVALRGQALREIEGAGDMVSLALGVKEAEALIARLGARASVAASNGPQATVVSGESRAVEELLQICEAEGAGARRIAVGFASHSPQVEAIRERFVRSLAPLQPRSGDVPFLSCLTGDLIDTAQLDGEYWYSALREPVRFTTATRALLREGCSLLIEMSPHPVLAVPMQETIDEQAAGRVTVIGSLRRGQADAESFLRSLCQAFTHGLDVHWTPLFAAQRARLVALPTYPFERERHWLTSRPADDWRGAASDAAAEHPLLATGVCLADRDEWLFSGRISLEAHPWLAEHTVLGATVLPASAFLEMALHAGAKVGCEEVEELTLEAPLVMPEQGAIELQMSVTETDEDGRRSLLIASRPSLADDREAREWSHHARGALVPGKPEAAEVPTGAWWPPAGAEPIELAYLHDRLAELGVDVGQAFRPLRAAWRLGNEIFADFVPSDDGAEATFRVDPALVDSLLYAASTQIGAFADRGVPMPFAWSGVRARRASSSPLRARVCVSEDSLAIDVREEDGAPALLVKQVLVRPLDTAQLRHSGASERELLLALEWVKASGPAQDEAWREVAFLGDAEVGAIGLPRYADVGAVAAAVGAGASVRAVLVPVSADERSPAGVRDAAERMLALLQSWLADERLRAVRLVVVTINATAPREGEAPRLAGAAVWGLVRSAQSEHPGRVALADVDGKSASWEALRGALALEESQLAIRDGVLLVPRLSPRAHSPGLHDVTFDPSGTVLITGGTGQLGSLIACHLAGKHGVRQLLLASRQGGDAHGAAELVAKLAGLGCDARVVACDVADRGALAQLLASIPSARPLTAVVHAAGTLDDGLLESLDRERLDRVMAPKVDAALALDELTAGLSLSAFVLVSSAVATLGGAGQANYAAANAVLDAVARTRRARGLVGQSLAFGLWERGLGAEPGDRADALAHLESQVRTRMGMLALEPERALALFDASLAAGDAFLVPVRLDMEILRGNAQVDAVSPVLRGLVPRPRRRHDSTRALRRRLIAAPRPEREAIAFELVAEEVASVVSCERSEIVGERTLVELGGESLDALELRNRLEARTGARLATRLFFGESLGAVARRLLEAAEEGPARPRLSSEPRTTLRALLESARASGRVAELISLLIEASRLRASCDYVAESPPAVALAGTGSAPQLICIPSFMVGSGPHQFARIARHFESRRPITALSLPGWRIDEPAPATWEVAIDALSATTLGTTGGVAYVLVGYSSGGALAHAVAERCEAEGAGPAGVVMIDTYAAREPGMFAAMLAEIIDRSGEYLDASDDELLAMGTFLGLAAEWRAGCVSAPSLFLRAAKPLAVLPEAELISAPFQQPQSVLSIDADHFTIIEGQAEASASAIDAWLSRTLVRENGGRSTPVATTAVSARRRVS